MPHHSVNKIDKYLNALALLFVLVQKVSNYMQYIDTHIIIYIDGKRTEKVHIAFKNS